ncbi:hypothetical protein BHM03_00057464 [Ensete ventricosum]|nr:hypothetical protein BHM03_00057464 [Ensete ventricosum]
MRPRLLATWGGYYHGQELSTLGYAALGQVKSSSLALGKAASNLWPCHKVAIVDALFAPFRVNNFVVKGSQKTSLQHLSTARKGAT